MIKKICILLLLLTVLWGCASRQSAPIPEAAVPDQFPSAQQALQDRSDLPCFAWWWQFEDSDLNKLITAGLQNNPDIHIALANLKEACGELQHVKLGWIPSLELFAGYSTNPALGVPGGFYGVWPSYAMNIARHFKREKQARYNVEYYHAMIDGVRLTVIGQIAAAYFTLMAQQEELKLLNELDRDLMDLINLTKEDVRIGLQNNIDLAKISVDEKAVSALIKPVEHNIIVSQNALRFLLNQNPGNIKTRNNFTAIDLTRFKPGSLPAAVLRNRPDLRMREFAIKKAHAGVSMAFADFFPSLQLDEFIGEAHLPESKLAEVTDSYLHEIIDPATFGTITARKGLLAARMAEYMKAVHRILNEVDNDLSANRRMRAFFQEKQKAEADYAYQYKLQEGLFKTGLISYKMLLENKIYLDKLALETNQAKLQLALSLVQLYQDLAGGYAVR